MCVTDILPAGDGGSIVSTPGWDASWICGGDYVATLTGYVCPFVAVEAATWGRIERVSLARMLWRPL